MRVAITFIVILALMFLVGPWLGLPIEVMKYVIVGTFFLGVVCWLWDMRSDGYYEGVLSATLYDRYYGRFWRVRGGKRVEAIREAIGESYHSMTERERVEVGQHIVRVSHETYDNDTRRRVRDALNS